VSRVFKLLNETDLGEDYRLRGMNGVVMNPYSETCGMDDLRKFAEVAFGECGANRMGVASFDPFNSRNVNWRVSGTLWFDSILYHQIGNDLPDHPKIRNKWFNVVLLESMPLCYKFAEAMEPHLTLHLLKSNKRDPGWNGILAQEVNSLYPHIVQL
jgi:hypothetical protein